VSRAGVYTLLVGDTALSAMGVTAGTVIQDNAVDTMRQTPFVVLRWEEVTPRWALAGSRGKQVLTVWAHDRGGDYTRINAVLDRIKEIFIPVEHFAGADGRTITQLDWRGESADLYDDGFKTLCRNHAYDVVGR
jgi:hypothetical protein